MEWVPRIDNRLATVLGVNIAVTATVLLTAPNVNDWPGWAITAVVSSAIIIGVSFFNLYLAVFPRTEGPGDSLTFFQSIQDLTVEEYLHNTEIESPEQYIRDLVTQTHRNSEIVAAKFRNLKWAFVFMVISLAPWIASLILLSTDS